MNYSPSSDSAEQNVSGSDSAHTGLALHRRHLPAVRPEVIIEIPAPVNRSKKFVWLGAGVIPLIITLVTLFALALRPQGVSTTAQEATVEARVALRLAEERMAARPQDAAAAALEATVEARVAIRLAEERGTTLAAGAAGEPTVQMATDAPETPLVSGETGAVFGLAGSGLYLRRGPGTNHETLALISAGDEMRLLGRTIDSSWFLVTKSYSDGTELRGWVAGWLVTIVDDEDLTRLPVVTSLSLSTLSE